MSVLRYLGLVALALWTGGLVALGAIGAPTIFRVLEAHDPVAGRDTAAIVFGSIFQQAQWAAWGLGLIVLVSLGIRAALGPRPRRMAIRVWTTLAMLAVSVLSAVVIAPRIDAIRTSVAGSIASLPESDPRRVEFGRLHGLSNGLMTVTVLAGLALMWAEMRDQH
jgi:hypothetical protein